jgi:hypothetical protein
MVRLINKEEANMITLLSPEMAFSLANLIILPAWLGLTISLFIPRLRGAIWPFTGLITPLILGVFYGSLLFVGMKSGAVIDFSSLNGVQTLMQNPYAFVAGWVHYLAFDLFVATQLCRRSIDKKLSPWLLIPMIGLCFIFGPLGLVYFVIISRFSQNPKGGAHA